MVTLPAPPTPGTRLGPVGVPGGTDRSYQVDIIVCAVVTAFIGTVFVALRFYTRCVIIPVLGWEDWLILGAQIFSIAMCSGFVHSATLGEGTHLWSIPPETVRLITMAGWYTLLFYKLSLWLSQFSILLLYIRIWTFPWVRRTTYVLLAIITVYNIWVLVTIFTACIPLQAFWDDTIQGAYCHALSIWWLIGSLHVVTDFTIYLLPMPVILQLRFPRRQKVLLLVLFTCGFSVCLVSIGRLIMFRFTIHAADHTFDNVAITFWSCVETNATVAIACVMTMKPLLAKWFPRLTAPRSHHPEAMADLFSTCPLTIGSEPSRPDTHPTHPASAVTCQGRGSSGSSAALE